MTMRSHRRLAVGLLFLTTATACGDSLLDVTNPSSVQESDLGNPALARTLVNSALGQFECAYTNYVVSTGVLASEYINASSRLSPQAVAVVRNSSPTARPRCDLMVISLAPQKVKRSDSVALAAGGMTVW